MENYISTNYIISELPYIMHQKNSLRIIQSEQGLDANSFYRVIQNVVFILT